jgi:hypothetical protein
VDSAVSCAASLGKVLADRAIRSECPGRDSRSVDFPSDQDSHHCLRALVVDDQVLLPAATVIRVPFDEQQPTRVRLEPSGDRVQQGSISADHLAGAKVDVREGFMGYKYRGGIARGFRVGSGRSWLSLKSDASRGGREKEAGQCDRDTGLEGHVDSPLRRLEGRRVCAALGRRHAPRPGGIHGGRPGRIRHGLVHPGSQVLDVGLFRKGGVGQVHRGIDPEMLGDRVDGPQRGG